MQIAEHLILIDQSRVTVVDDYLEAHLRLLPHQQVYLLTVVVERVVLCEVFLHLCRRHDAVALLVDVYMHDVALAFLHALLLLAERAEEVFHQAPVEECAVLVHPRHFEVGEVAHLAQRRLRSGYGALVLVEVDEHVKLVAGLRAFGHIALRHEYLSFVAAVEVDTEVNLLNDSHLIVVAEFYHIVLLFVCLFVGGYVHSCRTLVNGVH